MLNEKLIRSEIEGYTDETYYDDYYGEVTVRTYTVDDYDATTGEWLGMWQYSEFAS